MTYISASVHVFCSSYHFFHQLRVSGRERASMTPTQEVTSSTSKIKQAILFNCYNVVDSCNKIIIYFIIISIAAHIIKLGLFTLKGASYNNINTILSMLILLSELCCRSYICVAMHKCVDYTGRGIRSSSHN